MTDAIMTIHCKEKLCFLNSDANQKTGLRLFKIGRMGAGKHSKKKNQVIFSKENIHT